MRHVIYPHIGVLFSHKKMNDILAHATQHMNLEHIMVSEKSWAQKVHGM